jgi:hypothetical protein
MKEKTHEDCERLFREIESLLDRSMKRVDPSLSHCSCIDFCNRSGFEKSGFPYFVWDKTMQKDDNQASHIARTAVAVSFLEPLQWGEPRTIHITAIAERFFLGQASFFKRMESHDVDAGDATSERIETAILAAMDNAKNMMESEPDGGLVR